MREKVALLILLAACCFGCDKAPDLVLPEKSVEGLNTLGFMVNDCVWSNYGIRCVGTRCNDNFVTAQLQKEAEKPFALSISAAFTVNRLGIDQQFLLEANGITSTGVFSLDSLEGEQMIWVENMDEKYFKEFVLTRQSHGELVINHYDTLFGIVSGEFNGVLFNPQRPAETITIRHGRFDAELQYKR
ncbi:hypothetical protein [Chryseolinea lacunae]|uniref:Uncharacterized protein n=1 Tax=Chryseolinea lacunae TaxID=2801331 RepID=A0ABS1KWW8_9BACT|nr:hypothetical protein [Chryseolinea lacunae]MBL0743698.1 hypothetical protein [Chryseolinea lacunae]